MRQLRLERLEPRYALTSGELDPAFGDGGMVVTDFPDYRRADDRADLIAKQEDGKILIAGYSWLGHGQVFCISRLHSDGQVDTSFGQNGVVLTPFPGDATPTALAIQPDGKILLAQDSTNFVRYLSDGTVDTTFGVQGRSLDHATRFGIYDLSVQPDGKILAAVTAQDSFGVSVIRLDANGHFDQSFGWRDVTSEIGDSVRLELQPDGRFFVAVTYGEYDFSAQTSNAKLLISRFTASGQVDTTFSGDGTVSTSLGSTLALGPDNLEIQAQSDGKLVVATLTYSNQQELPTLYRLNLDGSWDLGFGTNGVVPIAAMEGAQNFVSGMHIQTDGRIVVSSYANPLGSYDPHVYIFRRLSDGSVDPSWDSDGKVVIQAVGREMLALAPAVGEGVLLAGATRSAASRDFAVWAYNGDGQPNPLFDHDGLALIDSAVPSSAVAGSSVKPLPDGRVMTASALWDTGWVFQRYLSNGEIDSSFGENGLITLRQLDPTLDPTFVFAAFVDWTVQPDGGLIICLISPDAEYQMQIRLIRLLEDGSRDFTFGQGGFASLYTEGVSFIPQRVKADVYGNVLIAGYLYDPNGALSSDPTPRFAFRFNSVGQADSSYGAQGLVLLTDTQASLHTLPLEPFISEQGELGFFDPGWNESGRDMLVRRLDSNGNTAGEVRLSHPNPVGAQDMYITGVSFLADGGYQAAGRASYRDEWGLEVSQPLVQRFSADGNLEVGYGSQGSALGEIQTAYFTDLKALSRNDGTVWIVTEATDRHVGDFLLYVTQLTPTGMIDRNFGDDGVLRVNLNEYWERFTTAVLTPQGIFVAGTAQDGISSNGLLAKVVIEASPTPWQNPTNPLNVSGDAEGTIAPIDALLIINALNDTVAGGPRQLGSRDSSAAWFYDVNGDGWVTAIDALMVINWLHQNPVPPSTSRAVGEGEGEADSLEATDSQPSSEDSHLDAMAIAWLVGGETKSGRRR